MDLFQPPKVLLDASPEPFKTFLENGGWYGVLGLAGLLVLLVVWGVLSRLLGGLFGRPKKETGSEDDLEEDLTTLPPNTKLSRSKAPESYGSQNRIMFHRRLQRLVRPGPRVR